MKEFSKEIIEIDGQEYTLFLNREGIVAWEKFCKKEQKEVEKLQEKYKNIVSDEAVSITEDTNPFEGIEDIDNDAETVSIMYERLYWIMLYILIGHYLAMIDMKCLLTDMLFGEINI